jgi:hypothetical protein
MNLPATVAQLRRAGVEILFSVGAGGTCDFTNAGALLKVSGLSNPLYDNFNALKGAMRAAEGDIDGIDFDNEEEHVGSDVMVAFGRMLRSIGYAHVTLCPYDRMGVWQDTLTRLNMDPGVGFVNAVHLQCYSGGEGNDDPKVVQSWQDMIASANSQGRCLLIPGLATLQPSPGPWWDDCMQSVENAAGVATNGQADWSNFFAPRTIRPRSAHCSARRAGAARRSSSTGQAL